MNNLGIKIFIAFIFLFGVGINSQAAVTDLIVGYGVTTGPSTLPTTWATRKGPESLSDEYLQHQEVYSFSAGQYVCFLVGLDNIDLPGTLLIDRIELTGPSGAVLIYNSGFESGTSGWSAWGYQNVSGDFSISSDAYEGSNAAKLTVSNSSSYSLYGQVPVAITESGSYTLSVYTKVQEDAREIPPDEVFAMEMGNQWTYDSNFKREITALDPTTFDRDTFVMTISENGTLVGREWYEVWDGYLRLWGMEDTAFFKFGFGLLAGWFPGNVGDHKASMAWVVGYNTTIDFAVDLIAIEPVTLPFDTLEAYRLRFTFEASGPGGTAVARYDWWFVPYIGVVKQQTAAGEECLVSFAIRGGTITQETDTDGDGLKDYQELFIYDTDPEDTDTDDDGLSDGDEVHTYGTDPTDSDTDDEGLSDGEEVNEYGTDPTNDDTDSDGLNDFDEIMVYHTDPNNEDTDGDELLDGEEIALGTNPNDPDTDGDLMADGWEATYGLDPLDDTDANSDLDGDGASNLAEFNDRSNPANKNPDPPLLLAPADFSADVPLTPALETHLFSDPEGDGHMRTVWELRDQAATVFSVASTQYLTRLSIPDFILQENTQYFWRAKFEDNMGAKSMWSDEWTFTTGPDAISWQDGVPFTQTLDPTDPEQNILDLNGDGIIDINQPLDENCKCLNTVFGGGQVNLEGKDVDNVDSIDLVMALDPSSIPDLENMPDSMPFGVVSYKLTVVDPDQPVKVTLYSTVAIPNDAAIYKYDPAVGWHAYPHAVIYRPANDYHYVEITLWDGGDGDADGLKNGFIVDPIGAGVVNTAPATGSTGSGGGGGCFIASIANGL